MQPFTIVTPIHGAVRQEVEIALNSFSHFFFSVPKIYRAHLNLVIVSKKEIPTDVIRLAKTLRINDAVQTVLNEKIGLPTPVLSNSPIMFLPFFKEKPEWVSWALYNGLPVLSYEAADKRSLLDNSCGMLVASHSTEESISVFAEWLKMLYFDPGAYEMMRKGAKRKYKVILPLRRGQYLTQVA